MCRPGKKYIAQCWQKSARLKRPGRVYIGKRKEGKGLIGAG